MEGTTIDKIDSSILKLQLLEKEFDLVMTQYKQGYLDYISDLNASTPEMSGKNKTYQILNAKRFWGESALNEGASTSIDDCQAMCSADEKCTGATFNSSKGYCWTRSGNGNLFSGNEFENAIIPEITQNINNLQMLNNKLINLNQQIISTLNDVMPIVEDENDQKNIKKDEMNEIYNQLLMEKHNIYNLLQEYETVNQQYTNNTLYVRQTNATYIIWSIIAIMIVIITVKLILSPDARGSDIIKLLFIMIIIAIFLVTLTKLNTQSGFLIFGIFIIIIVFTVTTINS